MVVGIKEEKVVVVIHRTERIKERFNILFDLQCLKGFCLAVHRCVVLNKPLPLKDP